MSRPMLVVFLTVVLDLVGFGLVIPLMPFYAETFSATPFQVTLLASVYSLAQFFFAPLWGQASDRWGRRPTLLLSIFMTGLMLAGFACGSALWMLFLFRTLHGVFTANIAIAQACMADLTTQETRAKGMGLIGAAFGVGFTFGPALGGGLASFGIVVPIWVAAGLSFLNFGLAWRYLPETRVPGVGRTKRSIDPTALFRALRHPAVGLCIVLTFLYIFAFAAMEVTFTLFAKHQHGLSALQIGLMLGVVGIVGAAVQGGLIHRLVRRFGEPRLLPPALLLVAVGVAALPLAPLYAPLLAVFVLLAVGQGMASPSLQSLVSRGVGPDEQGEILGSNQSMSALARAFGPACGGWLYESVSPGVPFWFAGGLLLLAAAVSVPAGRAALAGRASD
jgi:MFS transporter, DHA1 family, tetracycline resistance protein